MKRQLPERAYDFEGRPHEGNWRDQGGMVTGAYYQTLQRRIFKRTGSFMHVPSDLKFVSWTMEILHSPYNLPHANSRWKGQLRPAMRPPNGECPVTGKLVHWSLSNY
jgi:hypothetical protein